MPRVPRRTATRAGWSIVALAWLAGGLMAQPSPTDVPSPPPEPAKGPPPAEAVLSPEEALQRARNLLDRIDAAATSDEAPTETLDELNRCIIALQAGDPANSWLDYLSGRALAIAGRQGDAIDHLRRFVETRDGRNEWKAFRMLGDLFVGEYPRLARANYDRAAELIPDEPSVRLGQSRCAARMGEREAAIDLARRAVEADGGKTVRYLSHLARTLSSNRQWDEAERQASAGLRAAQEAAQSRPTSRAALQTVAAQYDLLIEIVSGRIAETSGANTDDYIRIADYMTGRAEVTARLARHDRLLVLQRAVENAGESPSPRLLELYAAALSDVGRNDEAVVQYEKLLAIDPENATAREALARLRPDSTGPPPHP